MTFFWTRFQSVLLVACGTCLSMQCTVEADEPADGPAPAAARIAWTTSRIQGSPEPPLPYTTERAFPDLKFDRCLDMAQPPGSQRMYGLQQNGELHSFPNRQDAAKSDLVVDFKSIEGVRNAYALTFHPDFQRNRYCYVCYLEAPELEHGTHVSRFEVARTDPPTIDLATEVPLITWLSGGHNGCCLRFGPDGMLYISTGDGGPANPPDPLRSGQDIGSLLSCILRLDVNGTAGDRNYRIPDDNPFVDHPGARGEIWAYGFRNPWRMSFDRQTGDLWVGDVGWELWELLDRVERGGNYGWAVMEGRASTHPEWPRGPTPILPPTIDHPHSESSSITDGLTYYGQRLPELKATHIYGDYDTGKIWGFEWKDGRVTKHRELADTTHRIVAFTESTDGEFYLLDHTAGTIHRMTPNPEPSSEHVFPRKLSESGLFDSVSDVRPAAGVIPYWLNAEPWMDHATAERLLAVPDLGEIDAAQPAYAFPAGSVLAKTLSLELEAGNADSRQRIETQILHFDGAEWYPYTYRWNAQQTDAELVDAAGADRILEIADAQAPGGVRQQVWRFAGRAECQRCHNKWSGPPLAFNTPQLNRPSPAAGSNRKRTGSQGQTQLTSLAQSGWLKKLPPEADWPRLVDPHDEQADLNVRARAYLHTNCAHCHRLHAGSAVLSKMHFDLPLEKTDMVSVRPTQGTFGIPAAQVIAPGEPFRSVLLYRMSKTGPGRMPYIGSSETDERGVRLIYEWLKSLTPPESETTAGKRGSRAARQRLELLSREIRSSGSGQSHQRELLEQMLSTTGGAMMLQRQVLDQSLPAELSELAVQQAAQHASASVRDLFERFLPPEQRVQRLGNVVEPSDILSLTGDVDRGRLVFFKTEGVACRNCHVINKQGRQVGPDLSQIGKKLKRSELLESILEPSKRVDPKFVTYLVETVEGRLVTGLLVSKDDDEVVLQDATGKLVKLPVERVEQLVPQQQSLMPELLVRDLTAQQVADLLAYLSSLR